MASSGGHVTSAGGSKSLMTEADVVAWANATVSAGRAAGVASSDAIGSLREPSLANGRFLLDLLRVRRSPPDAPPDPPPNAPPNVPPDAPPHAPP
eukprot:3578138-Prymnesium_polylepis.1